MSRVEIIKNGPIHIKAETIEIELQTNGEDSVTKHNDIWLCRCGHSNRKPFCDGSHKKKNFNDEVKDADTITKT